MNLLLIKLSITLGFAIIYNLSIFCLVSISVNEIFICVCKNSIARKKITLQQQVATYVTVLLLVFQDLIGG